MTATFAPVAARAPRIALAAALAGSMVIGALGLATTVSRAGEWRTTSSLMGESKYGEGFSRYDYVNPDAPRGGTMNSVTSGTFDSFNPFIVRGNPAAGMAAFGGGHLYDTLMQQATDEPGTSHPMIAEAFSHPDDFSSATYRIDPAARWHDGQAITADDVVWSLETLRKTNPAFGAYYANVTEAVALSEREVEFRFDEKGNRELPHIMGDLVVLPRHWWEGTDASGRTRDITQPTLEPPLGSGPYRVESFRPGSEIVWRRVEDYWAADLPVNVGRHNFDRLRYTYFQDENAAWQAFTKGGIADLRIENRAQRWATEYTFPAFVAGDVIKHEFATESGEPMQAYFINTRRPQLSDRRVREALTWAYDFENMNRNLFYGLYTRTDSFFEGGELASGGLPQGEELEILKSVADGLPPELFTREFRLPVYDTPQAARENLRRAHELLRAAGWRIDGGRLVDDRGEQMRIEFLGAQPTHERVALPYIDNLRRLGIDASIRIVDSSQYQNRVSEFDFDILAIHSAMQSQSPGNEQREFWGSRAADTPGSRNVSGIKDPAIDALISKVIFARDRDDLVAATRALDRALLWGFYVVPQWHNPKTWAAYWNKFGIPEKQPAYVGIDIESWWIDPDREAALAARYRSQN